MTVSLMTIGLMLKAYDQMSGVVSSAATKSIGSLGKVQDKIKAISEQADRLGRAAVTNGMVTAAAAIAPMKAYADQEEAITNLQVAMMEKGGKVSPIFDRLKTQIIELGNKLPGTTADYADLATTMTSLGIPAEKLFGNALDAAANLRVALKMTSEAAGETVVKLREAYNLSDNDLAKTADIVQRSKFAFGMKPEDLKVAASYQAAQLNILHLSGAENMKKMLVMQGMSNLKGLDGSSFGTNMSMMLQRLATGPKMLEMAHKGMKGVGKDILNDLKISFDFFDKQGNFRGLDAMIKEFEKFKLIEAKYGQKGVSEVSNALFGIEAARPAMILAEYGQAGYQAAMKRFEDQASLQERIDKILATGKNVWESFTGTVTNLMAALGGPVVDGLKPLVTELNDLTGGPLMAWVEKHQTLTKVIGLSLLAVSALTLTVGGLGLVVGTVGPILGNGIGAIRGMAYASRFAIGWLATHRLEILRLMGVQRAQMALQSVQNTIAYRGGVWQALQYGLMTTRLRTLQAVGAGQAWVATSWAWARANLLSVAGLRSLSAGFGGQLLSGLRGATLAARAFSLALLANPVTWIVAAVGGAAFLIYRYWKPISGFFGGIWAGLKAGLAPLSPEFHRLATAASAVFKPVIGPMQTVWRWLGSITGQVEDTGGAARKLGVSVGHGIAQSILWVMRLGKTIFELPGKFFDAGVDIVKGLVRGLESMATRPVETIRNMGAAVAGAFKSLLGIHSPSRVFMGFGDNIGEGAAIGINQSMPRVQKAVIGLAGTATAVTRGAVGPVRMPSAGNPQGGGAIIVHFSPSIQVTGGSDVKDQVQSALTSGYREFESFMRRFMAEQQRRSF